MAKIPGIYLDKKTGKWYFSASLGFDKVTGKRIQKVKRGFNSQREAYAAKVKLIKELQEMGNASNIQMSYQIFLEEIYIPDYKARVEETTLQSRIPAFENMKKFFGKKKMFDITPLEVQRWKNSLTKKYSQNYARLVYGMFSNTLDMAVGLGMIPKNIAKQVGKITKRKTNIDFWTKEEFEKVIGTFDIDDYYEHYSFVIVWLFFMTGLRVNEGTALIWDRDIDFVRKTLSVRYSLRIKNNNDWEFGPTKTKAGVRVIALDLDTLQILKDWKKRQEGYGKIDFVLSYNGNPSIKSTINRIVKRHAALAGVKEIQPKGLRHSHASLLINEQNANPLIIRDRLGHEDIKTTLGTYSHLYDNTNFEVADKLSGVISIETSSKQLTKFQGNQFVKDTRNDKK